MTNSHYTCAYKMIVVLRQKIKWKYLAKSKFPDEFGL
jgi:hypothetical protein